MINFLRNTPVPDWHTPLQRGSGSWLYPLMILLGFVFAIIFTSLKIKKKYKLSLDPFYWYVVIAAPIGILGTNFGSCVLGPGPGKAWDHFWTDFGAGLAVEWGVLFGAIVGLIYFPITLRSKKYWVRDEFGSQPVVRMPSLLLYLDALGPCVLLAQFLGRWGNYFNQEVYGTIVEDGSALSWFLYKVLPGMYIDGQWRQPLFLWEGLGNLAMFLILYFAIEEFRYRKAGDLAASYFGWYGLFRLCLEQLRNSDYFSYKSIVLSAIFMCFGICFIILNHLFSKKWRKINFINWFIYIFHKLENSKKNTSTNNNNINYHRSNEEMLYYYRY